MADLLPTIDEWRAREWGKGRCCAECGDPVILADTEDWDEPLCAGCYFETRETPP